jgi:hypothetical protein
MMCQCIISPLNQAPKSRARREASGPEDLEEVLKNLFFEGFELNLRGCSLVEMGRRICPG